jgi:hypothetical protein
MAPSALRPLTKLVISQHTTLMQENPRNEGTREKAVKLMNVERKAWKGDMKISFGGKTSSNDAEFCF